MILSRTRSGFADDSSLKRIWLLQDGEPLPIDPNPRLMRTGTLAQKLVDKGFDVTWWTSRFHHNRKEFREGLPTIVDLGPSYRLYLLSGPSYRTNVSPARVRHYRRCAAHFLEMAPGAPRPDFIIGSYPSPELCEAGLRFAQARDVPFAVDIRDPWPDIFAEYLPSAIRWTILPALWHYRRRFRRIVRGASGIIAVSRAMLKWGLGYAGRTQGPRDRVIYIGYNAAKHRRATPPSACFTPSRPLTCILVSSCGRSYDGALVIEAARQLHGSGEHRVRFVITGDGEMRAEWTSLARDLPNVHFTGYVSHEELQRHTEAAHIGLVVMRGGITRFWLGNKIFEYLGSGLAVLNNVPGEAGELTRDHGIGASVQPSDASALAAHIKDVVTKPELVFKWMRNAQRVFDEQFDRHRVYEEYIDYIASGCALHDKREQSK